jgi:hypothetical protein
VCSGAPGSTVVTAASKQTLSNRSYEADSNSAVLFTLPPNPTVGDTVWVSGAGTGGWALTGSGVQTIDTRELAGVPVWAASTDAGDHYWNPIAIDYTGDVVFGANDTGIHKSTDGGVNFDVSLNQADNWRGITVTPDGAIAFATTSDGYLYRTQNGGGSWSLIQGFYTLVESVDVSADGQTVLVTSNGGDPELSINGGDDFAPIAGAPTGGQWVTASVSDDGQQLIVSQNSTLGMPITRYSANQGGSWTSLPVPTKTFASVVSGDGSTLYALSAFAGQGGNNSLYVSHDEGSTWQLVYAPATNVVGNSVLRLATNTDGQAVAIGTYAGNYHVTRDGGDTWTEGSTVGYWYGAAVSGNGAKFAFGDQNNGPFHYNTTSAAAVVGDQFESVAVIYLGGDVWSVIDSEGNVGPAL